MVWGVHLYRENVGPRHSSDTRAIDSLWVGTLSTAAQAFLRLWEDAILAKVFDEQIMICKMSGAMISDMLVRSPIKERLGAIDGEATDVADGKPDNSDESNVIVETTVTIKQNPKYKGIVDDGKIDQWLQFARKCLDRRCVLFTDPGSVDGVRAS